MTSRPAGSLPRTEGVANGPPRAIVWSEEGDPAWRAARTRRALGALGLVVREAHGLLALAEALREGGGPAWLLRAGVWPAAPFEPPPPSATRRPLLALGAVLGDSTEAMAWRTAADLERGPLPAALSVWLEATLVADLGARIEDGVANGLAHLAFSRKPRTVRAVALDVGWDPGLRVAEIVTSLQQGGAERVALDLSRSLPAQGLTCFLAVLGAPTRAAFPRPLDVGRLDWDRSRAVKRADGLEKALRTAAIDVAHAHLLDAEEVRLLARAGLPVVVTLHNQRLGWPTGTESLRNGEARLVVACSRAVEEDARAAGIDVPCRTVWNGIDFARFAGGVGPGASDWRKQLGIGANDFVMLALANPRRQKRLDRLPEVLREVRARLAARGVDREARLVVAGAPSAGSADAKEAETALQSAIDAAGLREHVRLPGSVTDVAALLRAADVLVSTSAHEGLALSHLEALACGRPVVATAVGGAPEVAALANGLTLLPVDAPPAAFAATLAGIAAARGDGPPLGPDAAVHFDLHRMAQGYARALRAAVRTPPSAERRGLLLIANNFSTGGAQSSARRLLAALKRRGIPVRAAVLQEQPGYPTPGRRALLAAGVPVLAVPPPPAMDPARAVEQILDWAATDPPEAILLWNVIAEHKVLLAETAFDVPVFDVSPGEMCFESLERYFARPRPGVACVTAKEYGARLAGVVVKYEGEAETARTLLGTSVHVIRNGIDVAEGAPRGSANGHLAIGTLARLDPRKHVDRLLRALRLAAPRLPPHVLRIAGGPEPGSNGYLDTLRGLAEGLDVEFVGEADAADFLPGLDLFALVAEPAGCPNASLEAMARGLPVVATDAGGMREQIEDGVSGRLVGRDDEAALAAALVDLAGDAEARRRLGDAGRQRVRELFSMDAMADAYLGVVRGELRPGARV